MRDSPKLCQMGTPGTPATSGTPGIPAITGLHGLLAACHPRPAVAVTATATALAAACGHGWRGCALIGLAVLAGQLSIGWSNDWLDAHRDLAAGRADKPVVTGRLAARTAGLAAGAAVAVCVPLSVACGLLAAAAHLAGVTGGWLYNLGLKRTWWSWLPYATSFGLVPAFVILALPGEPWPAWWAPLAGALLGMGAHIANVLPDIADDLATGVRGLPQRLGVRLGTGGVRLIAPLPLLAATTVLAFAPPGPAGVTGWLAVTASAVLAVAGMARPSGRSRGGVPFLVNVAVAGIAVFLVVTRGSVGLSS